MTDSDQSDLGRQILEDYVWERLDEAVDLIAAAIEACETSEWEEPQHQLHVAARETRRARDGTER